VSEVTAGYRWAVWVARLLRRAVRQAPSAGAEAFEAFAATSDYPMFVLTAGRGRRRAGCLVGFATQTSIDPPRFLVCASVANATARVVRRAPFVGVHQLGEDQCELAALFGEESGDWTDKFSRCRWHPDRSGVPVLDDCPAWLIGRIVGRFALGDHTGLLLEPVGGGRRRDARPLMFRQVDDFDAGHPA
jgi:flavin reductase (DIM6/NTAB) family NADH-FMN oxidoreductase RutF